MALSIATFQQQDELVTRLVVGKGGQRARGEVVHNTVAHDTALDEQRKRKVHH